MPYANPTLVNFITECRKRGYEDYEIRDPLLDNGWPLDEVQKAFYELKLEETKKLKAKTKSDGKVVYKYKNTLTIHLDSEILKLINKRAKKNMLTTEEQIEDIIRRSCVNTKKSAGEAADKVDDVFLKLFSRRTRKTRRVV